MSLFPLPPYYIQGKPITPNLGLGLWGMDEIIAADFVKIDEAFGSISGSVNVNGVAVPAPANFINSASVTFSVTGSSISLTAAGINPIILASEQFINTTLPQTITISSPATQMYVTSIYLTSDGLGSGGQIVTATLTYTAVGGLGLQTITLILPLNTANVVMETYPVLVLGGTPITLTTAYGGAYDPAYTVGASIVQMPTKVAP